MTGNDVVGPPTFARDESPPRVLRRSSTDRVVAGVCGGLGRYLGVDPVIIRVAWVFLTLAAGTGLLLYIIGWLVIPEEEVDDPAAHPATGTSPTVVVGLVLVAFGVLLAMRDLIPSFDRFIWPAALVAVGLGLMAVKR